MWQSDTSHHAPSSSMSLHNRWNALGIRKPAQQQRRTGRHALAAFVKRPQAGAQIGADGTLFLWLARVNREKLRPSIAEVD
jgi:hypothetical protein